MLRIVSAYQGQAAYARARRAEPGADPADLWQKYVLDPYWNQWAAGEFNEERVRESLRQPYGDPEALQQASAALAKSGVEEIAAQAYARICRLLPYHEDDTAICILAGDPADRGLREELQGVSGECVGGNTLLRVNPAAENWQAMLPYVLAHERHHSAWGCHHYVLNHDLVPSLLAALVSEGSADAFAHQLCPGLHPAWTSALDPRAEAAQWQAMLPLLEQPDFDGALYRRFFFGDALTATPPSTGYTIGFKIVQGYLQRHPEESLTEWTLRSPAAIFAGSGYSAPQP